MIKLAAEVIEYYEERSLRLFVQVLKFSWRCVYEIWMTRVIFAQVIRTYESKLSWSAQWCQIIFQIISTTVCAYNHHVLTVNLVDLQL